MAAGMLTRRVVIWTAVALFDLAGLIVGIGAGNVYYQGHVGRYVGVVAVLIGIGSALGAWLVAALLSLAVELANNVGLLVELSAREGGER